MPSNPSTPNKNRTSRNLLSPNHDQNRNQNASKNGILSSPESEDCFEDAQESHQNGGSDVEMEGRERETEGNEKQDRLSTPFRNNSPPPHSSPFQPLPTNSPRGNNGRVSNPLSLPLSPTRRTSNAKRDGLVTPASASAPTPTPSQPTPAPASTFGSSSGFSFGFGRGFGFGSSPSPARGGAGFGFGFSQSPTLPGNHPARNMHSHGGVFHSFGLSQTQTQSQSQPPQSQSQAYGEEAHQAPLIEASCEEKGAKDNEVSGVLEEAKGIEHNNGLEHNNGSVVIERKQPEQEQEQEHQGKNSPNDDKSEKVPESEDLGEQQSEKNDEHERRQKHPNGAKVGERETSTSQIEEEVRSSSTHSNVDINKDADTIVADVADPKDNPLNGRASRPTTPVTASPSASTQAPLSISIPPSRPLASTTPAVGFSFGGIPSSCPPPSQSLHQSQFPSSQTPTQSGTTFGFGRGLGFGFGFGSSQLQSQSQTQTQQGFPFPSPSVGSSSKAGLGFGFGYGLKSRSGTPTTPTASATAPPASVAATLEDGEKASGVQGPNLVDKNQPKARDEDEDEEMDELEETPTGSQQKAPEKDGNAVESAQGGTTKNPLRKESSSRSQKSNGKISAANSFSEKGIPYELASSYDGDGEDEEYEDEDEENQTDEDDEMQITGERRFDPNAEDEETERQAGQAEKEGGQGENHNEEMDSDEAELQEQMRAQAEVEAARVKAEAESKAQAVAAAEEAKKAEAAADEEQKRMAREKEQRQLLERLAREKESKALPLPSSQPTATASTPALMGSLSTRAPPVAARPTSSASPFSQPSVGPVGNRSSQPDVKPTLRDFWRSNNRPGPSTATPSQSPSQSQPQHPYQPPVSTGAGPSHSHGHAPRPFATQPHPSAAVKEERGSRPGPSSSQPQQPPNPKPDPLPDVQLRNEGVKELPPLSSFYVDASKRGEEEQQAKNAAKGKGKGKATWEDDSDIEIMEVDSDGELQGKDKKGKGKEKNRDGLSKPPSDPPTRPMREWEYNPEKAVLYARTVARNLRALLDPPSQLQQSSDVGGPCRQHHTPHASSLAHRRPQFPNNVPLADKYYNFGPKNPKPTNRIERWIEELEGLERLIRDNSGAGISKNKTLLEDEEAVGTGRTVIAIVGSTGSGKSSITNMLLDCDNLVPTNSMRACTAVVTEIAYNHHQISDSDPALRAEIDFLEPEEWKRELQLLMRDLVEDDGTFRRAGLGDLKTDVGQAWAKVHAVYPKLKQDGEVMASVTNVRVKELMRYPICKNHLGTTKVLTANNPKDFANKVSRFVDSKEKEGTGTTFRTEEEMQEYWPLIKKVKIFVKHRALETGAVLVDLPGTQDSNSARGNIAKKYLKDAHAIWIVAPQTRAVDDKVAQDLLGETFRRQMQMDGHFDIITFITSKADDLSATEIIRGMKLYDEFEEHDAEVDKLNQERQAVRRAIDAAKDEVNNATRAIKAAEAEVEEWDERVEAKDEDRPWTSKATKKALAKRKRQGSADVSDVGEKDDEEVGTNKNKKRKGGTHGNSSKGSKRRKKNKSIDSDDDIDDDSDLTRSDSDSDAGSGEDGEEELELPDENADKTLEELKDELKQKKQRVKELKAEKKEKERLKKDESLKKANIEKLLGRLEKTKNRICALKRNEYSKNAIVHQFRQGLRELDQEIAESRNAATFDPTKDLRDYDAINLPVFCVSAREYGKLAGHFKGDGRARVFDSPEDTEIPALQDHCRKITVGPRMQRASQILSKVADTISTIEMFLSSDAMTANDSEDTKLAFSNHRDKMHKQLKEIVKATKQSISSKFDSAIRAPLTEGASSASDKAVETMKSHNHMHWGTYRATVRRQGVFSGSKGPQDWNQDLLSPFITSMSTSWASVFEDPDLLLKGVENDVLKVVTETAAAITTQTNAKRVTKTTSDTKTLVKSRLGEAIEDGVRVINEYQKEATRLLHPHIIDYLFPAYDDASSQSGGGCFMRMKDAMNGFVERHRLPMFQECVNLIMGELKKITSNVEKHLSRHMKDVERIIEDAFSLLWEEVEDRKPDKVTMTFRRGLLEAVKNQGRAIGEARIIAHDPKSRTAFSLARLNQDEEDDEQMRENDEEEEEDKDEDEDEEEVMEEEDQDGDEDEEDEEELMEVVEDSQEERALEDDYEDEDEMEE